MAAILAGGAVLSWEGRADFGGISGPLLIAGATLCWAIDNNLTQKVSAGDPVQVAMLKGLVAGTVNTAIAMTLGAAWPARPTLAGTLVLGFLSYGVSLVSNWLIGARRFCDIQRGVPRISRNLLTQRLDSPRRSGIIERFATEGSQRHATPRMVWSTSHSGHRFHRRHRHAHVIRP